MLVRFILSYFKGAMHFKNFVSLIRIRRNYLEQNLIKEQKFLHGFGKVLIERKTDGGI